MNNGYRSSISKASLFLFDPLNNWLLFANAISFLLPVKYFSNTIAVGRFLTRHVVLNRMIFRYNGFPAEAVLFAGGKDESPYYLHLLSS